MSLQILHSPTAAAVAAATSQEAQRAALIAAWAGGDVTVRAMSDATLRETETYGPWELANGTPRTMTLGPLLARSVNSTGVPKLFVFRAGSTDIFSMVAAVSPAVGDIVLPAAGGGISAISRTNLSDPVIGKIVITADPALQVADAVATGFALSVSPTTALNGVAASVIVTPNGPIPPGGLSVLLSASNGGTLGVSSMSFTGGATAAQTTTVSRASGGTSVVSMTNTGGLTNGTAQSFTSSSGVPSSTGTPSPFSLSSSSTGTLPFAMGFSMVQGHVPSGQSLTFSGAAAKLQVLTTWPDGSAKFGIVAGTYTSAGSPVVVTPTVAAVAAGVALTGAAVQAAMSANTAVIDAGAFGSATFSGADFASPFLTHAATDGFIEAVYRKQIGSDAHLVAWLAVRVWSSGQAEVLPWVENGYINVAGPTNKSATYTFTLGGTSRFSAAIDLKHHQRTPLISGSALSHWIATDPGVVPTHSSAYLQSTELVPSYYSSLSAGDSKVTALPGSYTPLQQGSFTYDSDAMTSTGYQAPIGLLPQHDVLYLISADADKPAVFRTVVRNGFSAGRYPIHYRDENTNKLLRFQDHPNRVISDGSGFASNGSSTTGSVTPTVSGTLPPSWDTAHSPSVGFMAYLLTGWRYFLEEVQFAATANYLGNGDNNLLRNGSQGLVQTATDAWQTRASAWDWRTHAQALAITPSTDYIYTDLLNRAHNNVDHFHGRYVAQANNAFGIILPGETYTASISRVAIWQQDFVTAAWGYSKSLGLPMDSTRSTKLSDFFTWKAQSIVGRLGTSGTFPFENANRYTIELGTSLSVSGYTAGTGPWPASWAAIYSTTTPLATSPDNPLATAGGNVLATEYDATSGSKGQWGEMQMAIAYAVRHGVSGASAAYNRMIGATNWASMLTTPWASSYPVMGVKPLTDPAAFAPSYVSSTAVGQIKAIAGTTGAGGSSVDAFSGWAYRPDTMEFVIAAAGGHNDSADNRVVSIGVNTNTPSWTLRKASTGSTSITDQAYQLDGTPSSRHTYQYTFWVPEQSRVMMIGCLSPYGGGVTTQAKVDGFNLSTNSWDAAGTWPDITPGYYAYAKDSNGDIWSLPGSGLARKFTASTGTFSAPTINSVGSSVRFPWATNTDAGYMFGLCWGDGQGFNSGVNAIKQVGTTQTAITFNASAALTQFIADVPTYAGMTYCRDDGKFYFYDGKGSMAGRIYVITPNVGTVWDMAIFSVTGGSDALPASSTGGNNGRFTYVRFASGAAGIVIHPSASSNLYFLRTA